MGVFIDFIEFNGERIPYAEAAKRLNVKYSCIIDRVASGWSPEKIMNTGKRVNQYV
jgi:hypothetical protein